MSGDSETSKSVRLSRDWRERLSVSRDLGTGFAAPGGEFTRALYEWALTDQGGFLKDLLAGRRVVELGAGMMPYGYALAATCGARNFVAVEPFYADKQSLSLSAFTGQLGQSVPRIPYKVKDQDMLAYLQEEADDLLCVVACGIEDCILPGPEYRARVESEIRRVLEPDAFFLSSHSDLYPKDLKAVEITYPRPSKPKVRDRLRLHGAKDAYERYGDRIEDLLVSNS